MAVLLADRVQETSTTSGTGTLTLNGPVSGYQSFGTGIGSNNQTYYTIYDSTAFTWEVGIGTYTAGSPNTLSRTTVLSNSSGTTALISFAANTKSVFGTYPASTAVAQTDIGTAPNQVPLNQYLGTMAFQNQTAISVGSVTASGVIKGTNLQLTTGVIFVGSNLTSYFSGDNSTLGFAIAGSEKARIDSSGNLLVGTTVSPSGSGNIVPAAAKGVNFTGNTGAAGVTSQLLTWYEEGTFTAGMTASTSGTITLNASFQTLRYTRIGRQVTVTGQLNVTSVASPVGILKITGLPFTSASGAINSPGISVLATGLAATATTSIVGIVDAAATTATLYKYSAGAVTNLAADVQASASFYLCIVYTV
ncbi:hypothetical protein UFOVP48_68 [uncultured Caudovirales phage]|uniref:Uncharacterized protein n=1 Tax=uncultured Caudovirales phage TaxID=2100421 RepID=A0A6J5KR63_9CAUD|nr:hypothetical protein UFOVP48_68 [uncultured Caudovirales phage]